MGDALLLIPHQPAPELDLSKIRTPDLAAASLSKSVSKRTLIVYGTIHSAGCSSTSCLVQFSAHSLAVGLRLRVGDLGSGAEGAG